MAILVLTNKEAEELVDMKEVLTRVEDAWREHAKGTAQMPSKVYITFETGDFRTMPAYLGKLGVAGVKIVNVHPGNPAKGLPTVMSTTVLLDPETGVQYAFIGSTRLTAMRTGAAGAIAAKYLSRKDSRIMAIIGAGTQARTQLIATSLVRDIEEVRVFDINKERGLKFKEDMRDYPVKVASSVKEAVEGADIVTTVTPSRKPIVMREWLAEGVHINAIGADAPGKEEHDPRTLLDARIYVDDMEQAIHSGEVNVPISKGIIKREHIRGTLGEVITGKIEGRTSPRDITMFVSTGLAIHDITVAYLAYQRAKERGIGRIIEM